MKNIDLSPFVGKNVNDLLKKGDQLFNDNLEGKIHAHTNYVPERIKGQAAKKILRFHGQVRTK